MEFSILQRISSYGRQRGAITKLRPLLRRSCVALSEIKEERLTMDGRVE